VSESESESESESVSVSNCGCDCESLHLSFPPPSLLPLIPPSPPLSLKTTRRAQQEAQNKQIAEQQAAKILAAGAGQEGVRSKGTANAHSQAVAANVTAMSGAG